MIGDSAGGWIVEFVERSVRRQVDPSIRTAYSNFNFGPMPELRTDPIAGHQVLIAEDRAARPNDFESAEAREPTDVSACPFCAGHEWKTPRPLLEVPDGHGGWRVRVIPNKYPAVSPVEPEASKAKATPLFHSELAHGTHEVIIESPRHVRDITELSLGELSEALLIYRDRLCHWSCNTSMRQATLFKNVNFTASASLQHIHSQLVVLPFVPGVIANEMRGAQQFFQREGTCVFCRLLQAEFESGERLVAEEGPFAAFCAYAGRQPFETWILPTPHAARFEQLADDAALPLASLLQQLIRLLQTQLSPLSYNLVLHTAPFGEPGANFYHWHLEIIPRTAQLAGLEWGTGVSINSLAPERAARLLREAKS